MAHKILDAVDGGVDGVQLVLAVRQLLPQLLLRVRAP